MDADRADEPHPDVQHVLDLREAAGLPDFHEVGPERARELMEEMASVGEVDVAVASVEDREVPGPPDGDDVPVRIYAPTDDAGAAADDAAGGADDAETPVVLYAHGGGWVVGSLDTADGTCRKIAEETGYPVVSVDYRLAPEHPFPSGLRDTYAALEWLAGAAPEVGGDPDRIVVAGDSAGGNLAAATALLARDRGGPDVAYQLLVYPVTGDATATVAYEENAEDYLLEAEEMAWFDDQYFADELDRRNGYALPRQLHDLSGLPPATVVTAGFDPLRDDGVAYAERLADCGVPVIHRNYPAMIHGFFGMLAEPAAVETAREAHADVAADLRDALE